MTPWTIGEPLFAAGFIIVCGLAPLLLLPLAVVLFGEPAARVARPAIALSDEASLWLEWAARGFLLLLVFAMLAVVMLRYVFGLSLTRMGEAALYAHGFALMLAAPAALLRGAHVRVDIFYATARARTKAVIDLIGYHLFLAPLMLALLVYAVPATEFSWRIGEKSQETDGLPLVFLLKTAILIFALFMLAQGMAMAGRAALTLRRLAPQAPPPEDAGAPQEVR